MILVIDIGNTNTKIALIDENGKNMFCVLSSDVDRTFDENTVLLYHMMNDANIDKSCISGAIVASSVPKLDSMFADVIYYVFGVKPIVVGPKLKTGLRMNYTRPAELGSDRTAVCAAALAIYGAPFIVVDFGAVTAFDAVGRDGEFLGGAISLGLGASVDALTKCKAHLPAVALETPQSAVARTIDDAIRSGTVLGAVGQVKYMLYRFKTELGLSDAKTIATGGFANLVQSAEPVFDYVDNDLSLKGLYEIYKLNA